MTLRLSAFFESHMKTALNNWKATMRRAAKNKANHQNSSSSSPSKRRKPNGKSSRRKTNNSRLLFSSEDDDEDTHSIGSQNIQIDDDDDDDDEDRHNPRPSCSNSTRRIGNMTRAAVASSSGSNRVTSSCSTRRFQVHSEEDTPFSIVRARRSKRQALNRDITVGEIESEGLTTARTTTEEEEDTGDSTESSTDSSNSDEEDEEVEKRHSRKCRQQKADDDYGAEDSEESYKPNRHQRRTYKRRNPSKNKKKLTTDGGRDINDEDFVERSERSKRKPPSKRSFVNGISDNFLQADEHIQIANTSRKRGRPGKATTNSNGLDDGPSTSASALRRIRAEQHGEPNPTRARSSRRHGTKALESATTIENNDHSYHLPPRISRMMDTDDTDSREAMVRPTRASVKRAILDWARSSDVEEAEEEKEENNVSGREEVF